MSKFLLSFVFVLTSCATYQYASNVKLIAFSDDLKKGKSIGNIKGEDCTWQIFGGKLGGEPTIKQAFINTKNQANTLESAGFKKSKAEETLRYVNNVTTQNEGFDIGLIGKECLVVTGVGYL